MFLWVCAASAVLAEARGSLGTAALVGQPKTASALAQPAQGVKGSSLFVGAARGGLFAPQPVRLRAFPEFDAGALRGQDVEILRALISRVESRRDGYDAVQHGARIKTPRPPTQMTLAQIFQWIKETPGQPHAIGRYQFIPKTLARVIERTETPMSALFTPQVQDALADVLLADAGFARFRRGELPRKDFMNNLAKIWAGLPNSTGRSHYHGYAGNKAAITWAQFEQAMLMISPE